MKRTRSETTQRLVPAGSQARLRPMPVTVSGISCLSATWILLTIVSFAGLVIAAVFPYWVSNYNRPSNFTAQFSKVDFGVYYFCVDALDGFTDPNCTTYLRFSPNDYIENTTNLQRPLLSDIALFFSFSVVYGVGGSLLFLSIFCGLTAFCKPRIKTCSVFAAVFCVQVVAGTPHIGLSLGTR